MEIDNADLKTIKSAELSLKLWPVLRWVYLAFGVGLVVLWNWLYNPVAGLANIELHTNLQHHIARSAVFTFGLVVVSLTMGNWRNKEASLLVRLAAQFRDSDT